MKRTLPFVLLGFGCAAQSPRVQAPPPASPGPSREAVSEPSCPTEREVILRTPRPAGGADVVRLHCVGEDAALVALTELPREASTELDMGEPAPVVIPTPAFVSLWNASRASVQKGLCVAPTSVGVGTLTLRNPQTGASRTCVVQGGTWERAANEARALVPPQAPEGEVVWPFNEYWKDEIRYYSATKR